MPSKAPDAFRTISEVGEELDLPQHVLRFWETRFPAIRPLKRGGGRRYYRPDDVDLLRGIRTLLYGQGYTIRGVQRIIKESGARAVGAVGRGEPVGFAPDIGDHGPDVDEGAPDIAADGEESGLSEPVAPEPREAFGLAPGAVARLRALRDDLLECRRILAAARTGRDR